MPRRDMDDTEEEEYYEDREPLFDDDDYYRNVILNCIGHTRYRNITLSGSPLSLGKALKHSRTKYTAKSTMPRRDMYDEEEEEYDEEEEEYDEDREQLFDDDDDYGGPKRKRRAHSTVFDVEAEVDEDEKEEEGAEYFTITVKLFDMFIILLFKYLQLCSCFTLQMTEKSFLPMIQTRDGMR